MDKKDALAIIQRFHLALQKQNIDVEAMILFGSYATNTAKEGSDIDLVVISKDFDGKGYWQRLDILSEAIYDVFAPIEAVAVTPEEWRRKDSFVCEYARHGEKILT
jgi:uncharacterized protein